MRTTIALDDDLLEKAKSLTGVSENTPLLREALRVLIARESARRLAALGGYDSGAKAAPRRRSAAGKSK